MATLAWVLVHIETQRKKPRRVSFPVGQQEASGLYTLEACAYLDCKEHFVWVPANELNENTWKSI